VQSGVQVDTVDREPFAALMRPVWDQFITSPQQKRVVEQVLAMREE